MSQGAELGRETELARSLAAVRGRIEAACAQAGRTPDDVTLVVVTKTFPASDVLQLSRLGVLDVGENRDQEAAAKVAEVVALAERAGEPAPDLRWHFVGQLQRNKAAGVARYADVVHSVDRARLVRALDVGAQAAGRVLEVLVQVDLGEEAAARAAGGEPGGRGGAAPQDVAALADAVAATDALRLRGVMAVAPLGADPAAAFDRLATLSARLRADHPEAGWLSAGMSGDLEAAVACGATHLRVGSAVLGSRPSLR